MTPDGATTMAALKACLFCRSVDTFVERSDFTSAYIICNNCGARGPVAVRESDDEETPGEASARDSWNARKGIWPSELTSELREILGTMCFQVIDMARLYREVGRDIPKRAEDEQAFFLHRFLTHWFEREPDWRSGFANEIRPMIEEAKKLRAEKIVG